MSVDIHEGVTYEITLKLRVKFIDASDGHGRCLRLMADPKDFGLASDRCMWVDENEIASIVEESSPVCSTCSDTHVMPFRDGTAPCTRCPTPCDKCRAGVGRPYCAQPRCTCGCHEGKR